MALRVHKADQYHGYHGKDDGNNLPEHFFSNLHQARADDRPVAGLCYYLIPQAPGHPTCGRYRAMYPDAQGNCWHCGRTLSGADYAREKRCPGCAKATHVCRNCQFYRPGRPNDCAEPIAERVVDKDRANFCDYFVPRAHAPRQALDVASTDELRRAAEALFRR
jgi:hypothetical protein